MKTSVFRSNDASRQHDEDTSHANIDLGKKRKETGRQAGSRKVRPYIGSCNSEPRDSNEWSIESHTPSKNKVIAERIDFSCIIINYKINICDSQYQEKLILRLLKTA